MGKMRSTRPKNAGHCCCNRFSVFHVYKHSYEPRRKITSDEKQHLAGVTG